MPAFDRPFIRQTEYVTGISVHVAVGEDVAGRMHEVARSKSKFGPRLRFIVQVLQKVGGLPITLDARVGGHLPRDKIGINIRAQGTGAKGVGVFANA